MTFCEHSVILFYLILFALCATDLVAGLSNVPPDGNCTQDSAPLLVPSSVAPPLVASWLAPRSHGNGWLPWWLHEEMIREMENHCNHYEKQYQP